MQKLIDVFKNPTSFDSLANYAGKTPEESLLVVMAKNRDSEIYTESNWKCALELLGGESNTVQIIRFGHWACGWIEYMCVVEGSKSEPIAQDIENRLEDYPILDECHYGQLEMEKANKIWKDCYTDQERIEYIRQHKSQFEFSNFADLMSCVRGNYFAGCANELIG